MANAPRLTRPAWLIALACSALAARAQTLPVAPPVDHERPLIEAVFKRFDTNGDGRLSKDEVARLPAIANRFDLLDTNKDGLLSPDEFTVGYNTPP